MLIDSCSLERSPGNIQLSQLATVMEDPHWQSDGVIILGRPVLRDQLPLRQWVSKRPVKFIAKPINIARLPDIISATYQFGVDRTPTHTHATSTLPPDSEQIKLGNLSGRILLIEHLANRQRLYSMMLQQLGHQAYQLPSR